MIINIIMIDPESYPLKTERKSSRVDTTDVTGSEMFTNRFVYAQIINAEKDDDSKARWISGNYNLNHINNPVFGRQTFDLYTMEPEIDRNEIGQFRYTKHFDITLGLETPREVDAYLDTYLQKIYQRHLLSGKKCYNGVLAMQSEIGMSIGKGEIVDLGTKYVSIHAFADHAYSIHNTVNYYYIINKKDFKRESITIYAPEWMSSRLIGSKGRNINLVKEALSKCSNIKRIKIIDVLDAFLYDPV